MHALRKNGTSIGRWDTFRTFLADELTTLRVLYGGSSEKGGRKEGVVEKMVLKHVIHGSH